MSEPNEKFDTDNIQEMLEFILNVPLFENLSREALKIVAAHMHYVELACGETLFNEWERAEFICFIERGSLDVMQKTGPDSYSVIRRLKRGRSLGEMSIIDNYPHKSTVCAGEDTRIAIFTQERFEMILQQYPAIGIEILKSLSRFLSVQFKKVASRLFDYMLCID
jgi:CRP/FNR family cyclic AMP-dependent transcriptional regulator